ncbi:MAG: sialidase family protein [Verrucomicrobia bacterium]|nr:sialidase family protein [Verrucomicrobiota bacterium]
MNKSSHLLTLGAALLLAPLTSAFAQSAWTNVDEFTVGASGVSLGLAAVENGVVFSAGSGNDLAGIPHAFVRRTLDTGQTWQTVCDLSGNGTALSWAVTVGQYSGLVFATATIRNAQNNARNDWVTLRSADGGTTWSMVDVLTSPTFKCNPYAVVEDAAGRVFVGGYFSDTANRDHYLVRRSLNGGTTWATVDDVVGPYALGDFATGMAVTPAGVFSIGRIASVWTVRRSTDAGKTWKTVDTYQSVAGRTYLSYSQGIAADANGNLYVTGQAQFPPNNTAQSRWITRKSADGGATWRTVDDVLIGTNPYGKAATVDAFGRVFVAGYYATVGGSTTTNHWVTRVSSDGGVTWATSEDYINGIVFAAASDGVGNVFVGGKVRGPISNPSAGVRKLAAP